LLTCGRGAQSQGASGDRNDCGKARCLSGQVGRI